MRFLIDTGSTISIISPEFVQKGTQQSLRNPVQIRTVLNTHDIHNKITYKIFNEFKQEGDFTFLIFKFHPFFDGILGMDFLTKVGAKIDIEEEKLETINATIKLFKKEKKSQSSTLIQGQTKTLIEIPVINKEGDIYINEIYIQDGLSITEGIYRAENYKAKVEIINASEQDLTITINKPIVAQRYDSENFCEFLFINEITEKEVNTEKATKLKLRIEHLNKEEKFAVIKLCKQYRNLFYQKGDKLTVTKGANHTIKLTDENPIYVRPFRYSLKENQEIKRQITDLLDQDIIKNSYSPWSAPVWLVPKKEDASGERKCRLVVDFRKINEKTIKDKYPLPLISEVLDSLGKAKYFSSLDLKSGYHQIKMNPEDIPKTAFTAVGGHYEFIRMPFGLTNAPATFQRFMNKLLGEIIGKSCLVYMDDIIVYSASLQQHMQDLKVVFNKLKSANLKIQQDKSEFLKKELEFLGHIVTPEGTKPNPKKIEAIQNFVLPTTRRQIKSFIGLLSYYRKFIKDLAKIIKPLTVQLKKKKAVEITQEFREAFQYAKTLLCNDPILQYPDYDKPFLLTTDASNYALGAVLSQGKVGNDKPVAYASRTLNRAEVNYSASEKEMLAIVWAVKQFRQYLYGTKFTIYTDHQPLIYLNNIKNNAKLIRWRLQLTEYEYDIVYKKGKFNTNADALSRMQVETFVNESESVEAVNGDDPGDSGEIAKITEKPINDFKMQLILKIGEIVDKITETPFKNKIRITFVQPQYTDDNILKILKDTLKSGRLCAIMTSNDIFNRIFMIYKDYFKKKGCKIIRATLFLKEVLNPEEQNSILIKDHENSNHRGIDETILHVRRLYYFPRVKEVVTKIINNCDICQTMKYDRNPQKLKFQVPQIPALPLQIVHIDLYFINSAIMLTIIDKFSKFAAAYTIQNRNTITIITELKKFVLNYGLPQLIICDQGAEFNSKLFKDFCKQYNMQLHFTSFQQSSSNSTVERLHSTLTETYRIIYKVKKDHKINCDHEEILTETLITYNNAIHSATKLTPFELFTGKTHVFNRTVQYSDQHDYLQKLNEFKTKLYTQVQTEMTAKAIERNQKQNETRTDPLPLTAEDIVFRKENRRNKITPRFSKHIVRTDHGITFETKKGQKVHKEKIKRKFKDRQTV